MRETRTENKTSRVRTVYISSIRVPRTLMYNVRYFSAKDLDSEPLRWECSCLVLGTCVNPVCRGDHE